MTSTSWHVAQITAMSDDIVRLAAVANQEGHRNLMTLVHEFRTGENRFEQDGEGLFGVYEDGTLTAIGGVNVDPYETTQKVARLRRLYVKPEFRRNGTGSHLTRSIESVAARHFPRIQLFTDSHTAGRFYASLGYRPVATRAKVSHEKWLNTR